MPEGITSCSLLHLPATSRVTATAGAAAEDIDPPGARCAARPRRHLSHTSLAPTSDESEKLAVNPDQLHPQKVLGIDLDWRRLAGTTRCVVPARAAAVFVTKTGLAD